MSLDVLQARIAAGEGASSEFVRSLKPTSKIGRAVCAFLNSQGGQVYCGVADDGSVVGIKGDVKEAARQLELELRQLISPSSPFSAEMVELAGQQIVVVEVPEGLDRPYVFDGGVYLRQNAQTVPIDAAALRALVRGQVEAPIRWERRISSITAEDLDRDELRGVVRKIESSGRFALTDREDDLAVLSDLSVYANGAFTHAGDILFSSRPVLRHPQCRVLFAQFAGEKADDIYKDYRAFEGPLTRVYAELLGAIRSAIPVQSAFLPGQTRRVDQPAYDILAIGEGLVNALVHRDYSAYSGGVRVQMFDNRIEIWNSGRLPDGLSPNDLRREHASILVNPDVVGVFSALDLMERLGRGTEKIVSASKQLGARPPLWRDEPAGVTLTIFRATTSEQGVPVELNERQNRLLLDLQPGEAFTPKAYQERYASDVTPRQARRDLEELETLNWLAREGATRSIRYRLR